MISSASWMKTISPTSRLTRPRRRAKPAGTSLVEPRVSRQFEHVKRENPVTARSIPRRARRSDLPPNILRVRRTGRATLQLFVRQLHLTISMYRPIRPPHRVPIVLRDRRSTRRDKRSRLLWRRFGFLEWAITILKIVDQTRRRAAPDRSDRLSRCAQPMRRPPRERTVPRR